MRKTAALLVLLLCLPFPSAQAAKGGLPQCLRFTQRTETRSVGLNASVRVTYPETANRQVNRTMRGVIDTLAARREKLMKKENSALDVGASVFRSGAQWMSFLTVARTTIGQVQVGVDFDARVFDMKTGRQISLNDLFAKDSKGWSVLGREVRKQLTAYFDQQKPNAKALKTFSSRQGLEKASFTLTPACLVLHYQAASLYPGKKTLMHVKIDYHQIRPYMTAAGKKITDCSRYKLLALTYDDGPAKKLSMSVMDCLRNHGASATFFLIGTSMGHNKAVICREHDAGHTVASHNYYHVYKDFSKENVQEWRTDFDRLLNSIIGRRASMMRAPGGNAWRFGAARCGLPLIQWSRPTGDAPFGGASAASVFHKARFGVHRGAIILMHDLNPKSPQYTEMLLKYMDEEGFISVTVDELFAFYGVPLRPNRIYYNCFRQAAKKK